MKYLYVIPDGDTWQSSNPPTKDELHNVNGGDLDVYSLVDGTFKRLVLTDGWEETGAGYTWETVQDN